MTERLDRLARQWRRNITATWSRPITSGFLQRTPGGSRLGEAGANPVVPQQAHHLLGQLLWARIALRRFFGDTPDRTGLRMLAAEGRGRNAVTKVVRKAKADRVGTAIADLTVCGAVPPYNELLGGKLVALLMAGPEMTAEYRRR